MKRFKVPIKQHISDFICTQNVWLTVNDHDRPFHILKQDSSHEVLLGISQTDLAKKELMHSRCVDNSQPSREYESIAQKNINEGDFILINNKKNSLQTNLHSQAFWVLFRRKEGRFEILTEESQKFDLGQDDFLVAFYSVTAQDILKQILQASQKNTHIAISQLNEILKICDDCKGCTLPLLLINYTTNESYSFSIKSTLNAVSLTIDMIKNKVIKYHQEKLWQIETVLHEALVNAITYGNELDDSRLVDISYEIGYQGIRIWVRDTGDGFDVKNISVPVGDEALDRISGRGIYIMKKFTEAIYFNHKGNEILLFFDF